MSTDTHVGDLKLRRLHGGELAGPDGEADRAHAGACAECGSRLRALADEQRRFEAQIPFERFAAGVERAARTQRTKPAPATRRLFPLMAVAAGCLVSVSAYTLLESGNPGFGGNRTKGAAGIDVVVAGPSNGPQRHASAEAPEALGPGERVRIGVQAGAHRFVSSVSIDEKGTVTPLYPEVGKSLPAGPGRQELFLPGSVEFTGKGAERLVVVLSDEALDVEAVARAAKGAYERANGDLTKLGRLEVPGEQFHRTFLKP